MTVFLGDFNAKLSNWYNHEKTSYEGAKFEGLAQHFGLQKITDEPTHILTKSSSCINLIFTSDPGLVIDSGVYLLLYSNHHH